MYKRVFRFIFFCCKTFFIFFTQQFQTVRINYFNQILKLLLNIKENKEMYFVIYNDSDNNTYEIWIISNKYSLHLIHFILYSEVRINVSNNFTIIRAFLIF